MKKGDQIADQTHLGHVLTLLASQDSFLASPHSPLNFILWRIQFLTFSQIQTFLSLLDLSKLIFTFPCSFLFQANISLSFRAELEGLPALLTLPCPHRTLSVSV